jgi:hypothetical protein
MLVMFIHSRIVLSLTASVYETYNLYINCLIENKVSSRPAISVLRHNKLATRVCVCLFLRISSRLCPTPVVPSLIRSDVLELALWSGEV